MSFLRNKAFFSLRGRLLLFLLVPLLIVLILSVGLDYRNAITPTDQAYDRALATTAFALAALVKSNDGKLNIDLPASANTVLRTAPYDKVSYAILDADKHLLAGEKGLADKATSDDRLGNLVFHDEIFHSEKVRLAKYSTVVSGSPIIVIVAESVLNRNLAISRIVATILWSNILLICVTMLMVFFGVRMALIPLVGLSDIISQRHPSDLRPISDTGVPLEARPLVIAINLLIKNLNDAHKAQQSFLTAAAHQLRTPIAGIQTQLELTINQVPQELIPRIQKLLLATGRVSHFTHQMLSLARSSPEADLSHEFSTVNLAKICEDAASEFLDAALEKDIDLGFETTKTEVKGSPWLLRELLANLIDNAIRYSPVGSQVTCRCGFNNNQAFIEVEDNGSGIPELVRQKIFDRFYRMESFSKSGTGLGLAIVKEVTERHSALVTISTPINGRGVCFRVLFSNYA